MNDILATSTGPGEGDTSNHPNDGSGVAFGPLFDTPQISTDADGVHSDPSGRLYEAVEVDGETTFVPTGESSRMWDRDHLVMPQGALRLMTPAGRLTVLEAAEQAAMTAQRFVAPDWIDLTKDDGEDSFDGPGYSTDALSVHLAWSGDHGVAFWIDVDPKMPDASLTPASARELAAALTHLADLAEAAPALGATASGTPAQIDVTDASTAAVTR